MIWTLHLQAVTIVTPPDLLVESAQSDDQTLITIEYRIDPKLSGEFEQSTRELGRFLKVRE